MFLCDWRRKLISSLALNEPKHPIWHNHSFIFSLLYTFEMLHCTILLVSMTATIQRSSLFFLQVSNSTAYFLTFSCFLGQQMVHFRVARSTGHLEGRTTDPNPPTDQHGGTSTTELIMWLHWRGVVQTSHTQVKGGGRRARTAQQAGRGPGHPPSPLGWTSRSHELPQLGVYISNQPSLQLAARAKAKQTI